jgi:hypothetical protein
MLTDEERVYYVVVIMRMKLALPCHPRECTAELGAQQWLLAKS